MISGGTARYSEFVPSASRPQQGTGNPHASATYLPVTYIAMRAPSTELVASFLNDIVLKSALRASDIDARRQALALGMQGFGLNPQALKAEIADAGAFGLGHRRAPCIVSLVPQGGALGTFKSRVSVLQHIAQSLATTLHTDTLHGSRYLTHHDAHSDTRFHVYLERPGFNVARAQLVHCYNMLDSRVNALICLLSQAVFDAELHELIGQPLVATLVIYFLQHGISQPLPSLHEALAGRPLETGEAQTDCLPFEKDPLRIASMKLPMSTTLAQLWLGLLEFYSEQFDFHTSVVCITSTRPAPRDAWDKQFNQAFAMAVADPEMPQCNLGRLVSKSVLRLFCNLLHGIRAGLTSPQREDCLTLAQLHTVLDNLPKNKAGPKKTKKKNKSDQEQAQGNQPTPQEVQAVKEPASSARGQQVQTGNTVPHTPLSVATMQPIAVAERKGQSVDSRRVVATKEATRPAARAQGNESAKPQYSSIARGESI